MSTAVQHRAYLTISEVAEKLRVSEKTCRRLIAAGELPALRVGAQIRVDADELARWLYAVDVGAHSRPLDERGEPFGAASTLRARGTDA